MQSGGSHQGVVGSGGGAASGGGQHGRNSSSLPPPGGGGARSSSSNSAASPSSSSSAVSAPHQQGAAGGFDSSQQQQQQQQLFRQSLQQQQVRKPEGDESFLAYQGRSLHGVMGGGSNTPSSSGSMLSPQQLSQQLVAAHAREDSQNKVQGVQQQQHQQMPNAVQQAYMQYAFQAGQQKQGLGNLLQAQQAQAQAQQQQLQQQQLQQHLQQQHLLQQQQKQQGKTGMLGPSSMGKEQDVRAYNQRMQELMSLQAQAANQSQGSASRKPGEQFMHGDKQIEHNQQTVSEQNSKPPSQVAGIGQLVPSNTMRPVQAPTTQTNIQNILGNEYAMSQLKAMHAWALESNIDLSRPENSHMIPQLLPIWQARNAASQKSNEGTAAAQTSRPGLKQPSMLSPTVGSDSSAQTSRLPLKQHSLPSPTVGSDSSAHGNSSSDLSGQSGSAKARSLVPGSFPTTSSPAVSNSNNIQMQQHAVQSRDNQASKQPIVNGMPPMHPPQSSVNTSHGIDYSAQGKSSPAGMESSQAQHFRQLQQLNRSSPQPAVSSNAVSNAVSSNAVSPNEGGSTSSGPTTQTSQQRLGFTKQQLHVLKAQILAFRRLKRGEGSLPQEVLQAIAPPPLESQLQVHVPPGATNQDGSAGKNVEESPGRAESNERAPQVSLPNRGSQSILKDESSTGQEKATTSAVQIQGVSGGMKEPMQIGTVAKEGQSSMFPVKSEQEVERGSQMIAPPKGDLAADRGKAISPPVAVSDAAQVEKPNQAGPVSQPKDASVTRKYPGPLFDFPFFTRKHDSVNSSMGNNGNNLTLAYDVKDLLMEEGMEVLSKKRAENLRKISGLLAVNLDRKRISPDLVVRLQIEEKKLRLLDIQARVRDEVDQQQQEIMAMPDRPYRKFVRLCERQRMELARQVQVSQKMMRERQLKSIFQWRKKLLESHWAIRDARTARNRGVAKYHERMLREFSKNKDDDRTKRMEALKNNDVDRYREMLLEQQTSITGDAAERYSVLSSFLSQTEEYLHKLGGKITAAKNHQEVEDAAIAAATAARSQGLSEEEVKAAAACAGEEVLIRKRFSEMNARKESSSVNKYYNLAHAVNEKVVRQPSMLRAGTLRDYQLVGLQWMLSLYNNKLNGILADEMGLGKTVQVMALIAYLMEFKGNYGPHLIIVPNAVLVNWKSELHTWLPSVSCIYYVGGKDQRAKLFSQEVCALKFNVLVTTYEFIMYDRTKLSKVDWKYIIIDEAQRMKDRESVLARDLDRYRCQRRLLLTGTPLQNDLKELWSLLNLLLPDVFDNRKVFHDWFSKPFQKDAPAHDAEDDWLETEKKVIIIHRLHQILEPFMLRRRVEDVEGSLPQKVSIVLRCKMSAIQGAIYDWVKTTGTIRVDPEDELRRVQKNPNYTAKTYKTLQNRCMELRKTCNHPLLNYPYFNDYSKDFLVRSCGKLWILDRILMKLQRTGHRVLLFSTMTKLLDLLEEYLQWRRLIYRRIDGTTSLDDRESAIVEFNRPDTDCFIFLLSIRAAGRGLNLQTADTVVIYDPDPNPKNEEQAVARAHRIGQKREVKVIYMEAVVDKVASHQKEDEMRSGGNVDDSEDDLAGKDRYIGSIESLIRNNIQQYKIDMADEVINAGRFDQRTTHEERRMTLETLLHDDERCQETVHNVPSLREVNRMIARSEEEVELFDQMDEEMDWAEDMTRYDQVPDWLRASSREVNAAVASLSKKPSKNNVFASNAVVDPSEVAADETPVKTERRRGRPKGSGNRTPIYTELDDDGEFSEASSEERNGYSLPEEPEEEEEVEVEEECEDEEEESPAISAPPTNQSVEESPVDGGYELHRTVQGIRGSHLFEEAGSSGSSSGSRRLVPIMSPSMSAQKFGSLSALESRPGSLTKRQADDLEEGEIAVSGDSQMDLQQSGSWIDREDGDDEQVLQPKLKKKRTMRTRPRPTLDRLEDRTGSEKSSLLRGGSSQLAYQADYDYDMQSKTDPDLETVGMPTGRHDPGNSVGKHKRNMPLRRGANSSKPHVAQKPVRANSTQVSVDNNTDHSRESWDGRGVSPSGSMYGVTKMSDIVQRKCKNVVNKLQKRIDKDGPQIIPLLTDFWKRNENSGYLSGTGGGTVLDLRRIDHRVERLEYNGVMDFVSDVQSMLKNVAQYFGFSYEVRSEAKKVQDLFFDIMKIAFPETDLREARNAVMFSAAAVAPKHGPIGQSKRHKLINEVDTESVPPPMKLHPRMPSSAEEEVRVRGPMSKFQKESRLASSSSVREPNHSVEAPSFTHPGELVICKKKRNDRDKSVVKPRTAGPVSPPSVSRNVRGGLGPRSVPVQRDAEFNQQSTQQNRWAHQPQSQHSGGGGGSGSGSGNGGNNLGWAKPVKRMRTDSGKRRPSHL